MRSKNLVKKTTNRGEFNRAYKLHLVQTSKICCSYCGYHKNENATKGYGGYCGKTIRIPNWKLVSKKPKQWMCKPMNIIKKPCRYNKIYIEIII